MQNKVCSKLKLWTYFVPSPKCLKVTVIEQVQIYIHKSSEHTNTISSYCLFPSFFLLPALSSIPVHGDIRGEGKQALCQGRHQRPPESRQGLFLAPPVHITSVNSSLVPS